MFMIKKSVRIFFLGLNAVFRIFDNGQGKSCWINDSLLNPGVHFVQLFHDKLELIFFIPSNK